jgi:hypothetical protein
MLYDKKVQNDSFDLPAMLVHSHHLDLYRKKYTTICNSDLSPKDIVIIFLYRVVVLR